MNWFGCLIGVFFIARGIWLMPTTLHEARSPLAPYNALRATGCEVFGLGVLLQAAGYFFAAAVSP